MTFNIVVTSLSILMIVVGVVGSKYIARKKDFSPEYKASVYEQEREIERREKEDKELDDFYNSSNEDYLN